MFQKESMHDFGNEAYFIRRMNVRLHSTIPMGTEFPFTQDDEEYH